MGLTVRNDPRRSGYLRDLFSTAVDSTLRVIRSPRRPERSHSARDARNTRTALPRRAGHTDHETSPTLLRNRSAARVETSSGPAARPSTSVADTAAPELTFTHNTCKHARAWLQTAQHRASCRHPRSRSSLPLVGDEIIHVLDDVELQTELALRTGQSQAAQVQAAAYRADERGWRTRLGWSMAGLTCSLS